MILNEMTFRKKVWNHQPITDCWRVGKGYAKKLAEHGMHTMGDVARCSVKNEELLYKLFGVNAELLIYSCRMIDIHNHFRYEFFGR